MEYRKVSINDIIPYENNPRINTGAVKYVKESISQCGYISPIIVDENMVILAGHTRRLALLEMGIDEIEIGVAAGLTDEQKRKYRVLDNKTNEFATWDFEKLTEELENIDFGDFDFGFSFEIEREEPQENEVKMKDDVFQIIVDCDNENDMEQKFNKITEMGIECRISTL